MKVISESNDGGILTWDRVLVVDDSGENRSHGVKRITLNVEAGSLAYLDIETYDLNDRPAAQNIDVNTNSNGPITYTQRYYVKGISIEAKLPEDIKESRSDSLLKLIKEERIKGISAISELEL